MTTDPQKPQRRRRVLNVQVPFFRPIWRRVLTLAIIVTWVGVEVVYGNPYWAVLAAGIGAYIFHQFFIAFAPEDDR